MTLAAEILGVAVLIAAHEAGHAVQAMLLGYPVRVIGRLRPVPLVAVQVAFPGAPPRGHSRMIAAAGPAVSLLLAVALAPVSPVLCVVSVILGLESLLPLPRHDGLRMLRP